MINDFIKIKKASLRQAQDKLRLSLTTLVILRLSKDINNKFHQPKPSSHL